MSHNLRADEEEEITNNNVGHIVVDNSQNNNVGDIGSLNQEEQDDTIGKLFTYYYYIYNSLVFKKG